MTTVSAQGCLPQAPSDEIWPPAPFAGLTLTVHCTPKWHPDPDPKETRAESRDAQHSPPARQGGSGRHSELVSHICNPGSFEKQSCLFMPWVDADISQNSYPIQSMQSVSLTSIRNAFQYISQLNHPTPSALSVLLPASFSGHLDAYFFACRKQCGATAANRQKARSARPMINQSRRSEVNEVLI